MSLGCNKLIKVTDPRGLSFRQITTTCGSVGFYGLINLCEECREEEKDNEHTIY